MKQNLRWALFCAFSALSLTAQAGDGVKKTGDFLEIALPMISLTSSYFLEDDNQGSIQFLKAFAASELTTFALKQLVNERRPNGHCCESFPSGHTSASFMAASFIQYRYGWKYSVPAYIAATYVGYSRVDSKEHYTKDVLAGAAIGILSSYWFTEKYQGFEITPYGYNGQFGLQVSRRF